MDDIDRVKEAIDPVAFISTFTPLQRRGNRYWGLSPFTNEKTPSFTVRPDGLFYCFSTGTGGDIIRFIELKEGLGFRDALERAAEFAGVTLSSKEAGPDQRDKGALKAAGYDLLRHAAMYFHRMLLGSSKAEAARNALLEREFEQTAWEAFQLGYAWGETDDWTELTRKKGWSLDVSRQVGLTHANQNRDRFRHRLMFPIFDTRGQTAGFGGRRLNEAEDAKYINSADSLWFHKGQLLFAYTLAQPAWRSHKRAILCEGYTDVMRLHGAGYSEAVAPLGTALTAQQAARIGAHVQSAVLAFDGDAAGAKAALNAWSLLVQRGVEVLVLDLPAGEDPDSLLRKQGREAMQGRLDGAAVFWPSFLERTIRDCPDVAQKRRQIELVVDKIAGFSDTVLAELLADELAQAAGISGSAIRSQLHRQQRPMLPIAAEPRLSRAKLAPFEEKLATFVLTHPERRFDIVAALAGVDIHPWLKDILAGKTGDAPGFRDWAGRIAHQEPPPEPEAVLLAGVREWVEKRAREQQLNELNQLIQACRTSGDEAGAQAALKQLQALANRQ